MFATASSSLTWGFSLSEHRTFHESQNLPPISIQEERVIYPPNCVISTDSVHSLIVSSAVERTPAFCNCLSLKPHSRLSQSHSRFKSAFCLPRLPLGLSVGLQPHEKAHPRKGFSPGPSRPSHQPLTPLLQLNQEETQARPEAGLSTLAPQTTTKSKPSSFVSKTLHTFLPGRGYTQMPGKTSQAATLL